MSIRFANYFIVHIVERLYSKNNNSRNGMIMMSPEIYQGIAIVLYMTLMLLIGWYGYRQTTDLDDYMLGGRSLGAAVTALSAGAADMSGWLLMGLPGEIYK